MTRSRGRGEEEGGAEKKLTLGIQPAGASAKTEYRYKYQIKLHRTEQIISLVVRRNRSTYYNYHYIIINIPLFHILFPIVFSLDNKTRKTDKYLILN